MAALAGHSSSIAEFLVYCIMQCQHIHADLDEGPRSAVWYIKIYTCRFQKIIILLFLFNQLPIYLAHHSSIFQVFRMDFNAIGSIYVLFLFFSFRKLLYSRLICRTNYRLPSIDSFVSHYFKTFDGGITARTNLASLYVRAQPSLHLSDDHADFLSDDPLQKYSEETNFVIAS